MIIIPLYINSRGLQSAIFTIILEMVLKNLFFYGRFLSFDLEGLFSLITKW